MNRFEGKREAPEAEVNSRKKNNSYRKGKWKGMK